MSAQKEMCPFCHGAKMVPTADPKWNYVCVCNARDKSPPRPGLLPELRRKNGLLPAVPIEGAEGVALLAQQAAEAMRTAKEQLLRAGELAAAAIAQQAEVQAESLAAAVKGEVQP